MKTIFRVLVILIAAAIVGGIIFVLVGNTAFNTRSGFDRHGGNELRPGDNAEFRPDENFAPRPERDREEFSGGLFFPGGVLKGLLVVSVVMLVWLNVGKLFRKVKTV